MPTMPLLVLVDRGALSNARQSAEEPAVDDARCFTVSE